MRTKLRYLEAYLQHFDRGGKDSINVNNARQALVLAQTQLKQESLLTSSGEIFSTSISNNRVSDRSVSSCPFASQLGLV